MRVTSGIAALFVLAGSINLLAQTAEKKKIVFKVFSPDLPDTAKVYITGSLGSIGFWDPSKVQMQNEGNHIWGKEIVSNPISIEYKFTLGSWEREAANANGMSFQNFILNVKRDTIVKHDIFFWKSGGPKAAIASRVTGTVKYHRQVKGDGILPRDVVVWLPPGYEKKKKNHYPVVYMHDGQNIFDPATSSFGVDWRVDETADSLIRKKNVKPFIVVGIYNTSDRTKEYTPGDGGNAYMNFVIKKLKPMIDSSYRTLSDRKHTHAGGSSAGGLISFMLAWEHPDIFSSALCMSPAFKIRYIDYVKPVVESTKKPDVFFYIDNGGVGLESELQPGIDEMMNALKQKGYQEGKNYFYKVYSEARHFEADWAKRFPAAILQILSK